MRVRFGQRIERSFFERYTPRVAEDLLGNLLVRVVEGQRVSGLIVETEAYRGARDPASHAHRGRTKRNEVMFGEGGHAYVYLSYGTNWCLNLTTEPIQRPGAVLVRALEPVEGIPFMMRRRKRDSEEGLTDGPGKLTQAMGIDRTLNGEDVANSRRLFLEGSEGPARVGRSTRVGIRAGTRFRWRFYVDGSAFVSRGKPSFPAQNP